MFTRAPAKIAALVLTFLLVLTGCSLLNGGADQDTSPSSNSTLEVGVVKVAVPKTIDTTPLHIAIREGYFKQEGLKVDIVDVGGGGDSLAKLPSGEVNIAFSSYAPFFLAQSKNAFRDKGGVKIIADASSASPGSAVVVAPPQSRVKSIRDLAGARVAVTDPSSISVLLIKSVLKTNHVDARGIKWVPTPFPATSIALEAGNVDAAFVVDPFLQDAHKKAGAAVIFDVAQGPTADFPTAGWGSTGRFVSKNPNTIAAFQRALQRGTDLAISNRTKVEAMAVDKAGVDRDTAKLVVLPTFQSRLDATRLQRVPDLLLEFKVIRAPVDAKSMVVASAPLN